MSDDENLWAVGSYRDRTQFMIAPSNEELNYTDIQHISNIIRGCDVLLGVGTLPLTIYAEEMDRTDTRKVVSLDYLPTMVFPLLLAKYLEIQEEKGLEHCLNSKVNETVQEKAAIEFEDESRRYLEVIFQSRTDLLNNFKNRFPNLSQTLRSVFAGYSSPKATTTYLFKSAQRKRVLKAVFEERIEFDPVNFMDTNSVMSRIEKYQAENMAIFLSNVCESTRNHLVLSNLYHHSRTKAIILSVPAPTGIPRQSSIGYYFDGLTDRDYSTVTQTGQTFLVQAIRKPD